MADRPIGRKKNIGQGGSGVHKRGDGLGGGPVGSSNGYSSGGNGSGSGSGGMKRSRGRSPLFIVIIILFLVLGGGGGLTSFLGGSGDTSSDYESAVPQTTVQQTTSSQSSQSQTGFSNGYDGSMFDLFGSMLGGGNSYTGGSMASASWSDTPNTGKLDTSVVSGARAKRTTIKGNGQDTITIMVYMCGADLESRGGMASKDIQEMLSANLGDKINLILYTGGAKQWQNNVISSSTNQIYQVKDGKLL